ncbi:hypothetical protein [Cellulosimicrobium sp. CUA-896]|uniref:hypothetical protein n=1 Tax=Cellulosimicrobium sp. CUA-896 TaxID=1517881 RepID=UPI0009697CB1|nr:hypothetical protein [Cellulosimicrobium sp. CUA-896]OLT49398.1 hypothetical protein BJF88_02775 [Cellulosimicrobium sp. CUA-896]
MTREVTSAGGFRIVLPGTWGNVPLGSPEESERFVRRLVRRQVGSSDRLARARREASQEILRNVRDAAAAASTPISSRSSCSRASRSRRRCSCSTRSGP